MRALFYSTDASWTGRARAFAAAARGLHERGYQVTYVCREEGFVAHALASAPYEVVPLDEERSVRAAAARLAPIIRDRFSEVVFVNDESEHLAAAWAIRRAERGAVVRRVPAATRLRLGASGRLAVRLAATGFLFGEAAEAKRAALPRRALGAVIAEPGVVAEPREEPAGRARTRDGERLIVVATDARGRRRASLALRTLALLAPRHPALRLVFVGPESDHDDLRVHASAIGVGDLVRQLGEREDAAALMRRADLGWVVAAGDDGAFATLDFMAARVPVLAERSPLTQRYVADGITGQLLAAGDAPNAAAVVSTLLGDEERRLAMGNAARVRVVREFPERAMVDGFQAAADAARDRTKWTV